MAVSLSAAVEVDLLHVVGSSFAGVRCGQMWADFYLWEIVLNAHPELKAIVEIGTWEGGFSRYLDAQAGAREIAFRTYDAVVPKNPPPGFERLDVFAEPEKVIPRGPFPGLWEPLILLCDGGNKPRELRAFPPYLGEGSLVVVHDWLTEVMPEDVPAGLEMVYEGLCEALGSMSRVFKIEGRS